MNSLEVIGVEESVNLEDSGRRRDIAGMRGKSKSAQLGKGGNVSGWSRIYRKCVHH